MAEDGGGGFICLLGWIEWFSFAFQYGTSPRGSCIWAAAPPTQLKWKSFGKQLRAFVKTAWHLQNRKETAQAGFFLPLLKRNPVFGHLEEGAKVHPEHILRRMRGQWGPHSTSWCTTLYQSWGTLTYNYETRSHRHSHIPQQFPISPDFLLKVPESRFSHFLELPRYVCLRELLPLPMGKTIFSGCFSVLM